MTWKHITLAALLLGFGTSAPAGWFEKKKPENPAVRVAELVSILKNQPSASKRSDAAEELCQFDAATYPEIVPSLITALQKDSSSSVRSSAAESLGKIKPTSAEAQEALEQALKQEDSAMVRWHSRKALWGYRLPKAPKPDESNLVKVPPPDASGRLAPVPVPQGGQTKPLPAPPANPKEESATTVLKPEIVVPNQAKTTSLPKLAPPTKINQTDDKGPILVLPPRP